MSFSGAHQDSILPYEHGLPEKRELFREQWRDLWIFRKGLIWLLLKEVKARNHLQEVQHIAVVVLKPRFTPPLESIEEPLTPEKPEILAYL